MDKKDEALWVQTLWNPLEEISRSPLNIKNESVRVAAYCRVSYNPKGQTESLFNQLSQYTHKIADQPNWKFIGIYFDNMVTGRRASLRRGFTRMLRHCEEGKIDLILVKSVSRFSRNAKELVEIVNRLKELKVTVFFEAENIDSSISDSTYLLKTYAALAQGESEELSAIIEWGHEKQFSKGIPLLGNLYGYTRSKNGDGKIEIVEDEAEIVREIFRMFVNGKSFTDISNTLTERKIRTKFGKSIWTSTTVRSILMNLSYTGNHIARKVIKDLFTDKYHDSKGIRDQYYIENSHQGIVDQKTFDTVQNIIEMRGTRKLKVEGRSTSALTSRIQCGNCLRNYYAIDGPPNQRRQCPTNRKNSLLCPSPILRESKIREMLFVSTVKRFKLEQLSDIRRIEKLINTINNNDHFEFHRLKAMTSIDSARKLEGIKYTSEDIRKMEVAYSDFEKQLIKIEDDRPYRLAAVKWLKSIDNFNKFKEQVTIELMRALITEVVIFSEDDYIVRWVDGVETEIGNCQPAEKIQANVEIEKGHKTALPHQKSINVQNNISENKNQEINRMNPDVVFEEYDSQDGENSLEVVKIQPTVPSMLLAQVQKSIKGINSIETNLPQNLLKKLRVAAYVRVSTDSDEQAHSFKTQLAFYSFYLLQHPNYEMVGIYADEGISGKSTKNRKEFNKMINDCKAGKIDLIITKSISRFARNTVDILYYTRMLSELDPPVHVLFERENLSTKDLRSQVLISLLGSLSQEESVNLAHSVAWSKRNSASRGVVRAGVLGYGYKHGKNDEWLIVEEEAKVVRRIFKDFLGGKSVRTIGHELTTEKVKTPKGQINWNLGTIMRILNSERYCGDYLFMKCYSNLSPEKKIIKNKGEKEQYYIEAHHQPIVEKDQWNLVQELLERNKIDYENKKRTPKLNYKEKNEAFLGHFICDMCGSKLSFSKIGSGRYTYLRWRCFNGGLGYCDSISFEQKYLEENFSQLLMDIKFNGEYYEQLSKLKESLKLTNKELDEKETIIESISQHTHQLHHAVAEELEKKGKDAKRIDEITSEILELRSKIADFEKRQEQLESIAEYMKYIEKSLKAFNDPRKDENGFYINTPEFLEAVFEKLVDEGILYKDGRVVYRLKFGMDWSAPTNLNDYKKLIKERKRRQRMEEKVEKR